MRVLILGCGYLGQHVGALCLAKHWEVWGVRRDPAALARIQSSGIQPLTADLLNPEDLERLPQADVAILCQAPSRQSDSYTRTYKDVMHTFMNSNIYNKLHRLILVSSTGVYDQQDGAWVDEATPLPSGAPLSEAQMIRQSALLAAEQAIHCGSVPNIVLRLGGIYGPGRNRIDRIRTGQLQPSFRSIHLNRIHVHDAASAIVHLIQYGVPREVYLGVDDAPVTEAEFFNWLCQALHIATGSTSDPSNSSSGKRCSNAKLKSTGWQAQYPSFREGYQELLRT